MSFLDSVRAHYARLRQRRKAMAELHPELLWREHLYSSSAQFAASEADSYVGAARLYRQYVWVRKAISLYAQNIAPLPVRVVDRDGAAVSGHPLTQLYANPNHSYPAPRYWAILTTHMLLGGERFSEIVDTAAGRPRELWPRRPDRVQIAPDDSQPGYPQVGGYHLEELAEGQRDVPPETVIHEMFVNPLSEWRGLGPIPAVLAGIQIDLLAQAQARLFYKNQARPDYAIKSDQMLTPEERTRLELLLDQKFSSGGSREGRPIVLEYGQDVKTLSFPPKDVESLAQRAVSRDEVAAIFGVPDILMGFGAETYDTMEKRDAAMAVFWLLALLPVVQQRDETETHFWREVRPLLGAGQRVATDLSGVRVLQEAIGPKLQNAIQLFRMGVPFNLIDSALKLGIGPIPGGEIGYLPAGLVPADQAGVPASPPKSNGVPAGRAALGSLRTRWTSEE